MSEIHILQKQFRLPISTMLRTSLHKSAGIDLMRTVTATRREKHGIRSPSCRMAKSLFERNCIIAHSSDTKLSCLAGQDLNLEGSTKDVSKEYGRISEDDRDVPGVLRGLRVYRFSRSLTHPRTEILTKTESRCPLSLLGALGNLPHTQNCK